MRSYQRVLFFMFCVVFAGQHLCVLFACPGTSPWQPINDEYIQEGNQSLWCKSQFKVLDGSDEVGLSGEIGRASFALCSYSYYILVFVYLGYLSVTPNVCGEALPTVLVWCFCVQICLLCAFMAWFPSMLAEVFPVSVVSTCVPVEADVLLLPVWSNSEWNSTDAWLEHANITSVGAAETIHSWFLGVRICLFMVCAFVLFLIGVDYDPAKVEGGKAPAVSTKN